jgi:putative heme-binding domain-containing protein
MRVWAGLFLVVVCCGAEENPFAADRQAVEAGRGIFRVYCSPCHGIQAQGGRAPDLTRGTYAAGDRDSDVHKVISNGVPGTEMPDFSDRLGAENIWRVVSYIRSTTQASAPAKGERGNGEKLFWGRGGCGGCHRIGSKGGRLGPDLSRIGRQRSLAYLKESIVSPNAEVTPGYYTIVVVTRDGKKIVGAQRSIDNFSVQLMDSAENIHSFFTSDVTSVQREFRSLMPDNYGSLFNPAELDDLVAYLSSLRGGDIKQ